MSILHKPVRALISWFSMTVLLCVTITVVLTHTGAQVADLSATEQFGDCFGGPVEDINLWGMIQKNEFVLIITLILIGMAAYSLELMAERLLTIAIGRRQSLDYQRRVGLALFHRRFEEAATLSAEYPKSPIALAVHAFVRSNTRAVSPDSNPSMQEWQRTIVIKSAEIKHRLWTLGAIGWSAPLVGMLYASVRITQTFQSWHSAEGSSFAPFADEIAFAALGVSFGVVVAVPAIWAYRYFCAQAETVLLEMENLSLAIIEQLFNQGTTDPANTPNAYYITQKLNKNSTQRITR